MFYDLSCNLWTFGGGDPSQIGCFHSLRRQLPSCVIVNKMSAGDPGPFSEWFFHHNSKLMVILLCFHPSYSKVIIMKFANGMALCCHGLCKLLKWYDTYNGVTLKQIFNWILITMEKLFVKWTLGCVGVWQAWCWPTLRIILTHWGQERMAAISQTTFSSAFSWMKIYEFRLKFHWSLCPRVQITIFQHWFR